MPDDSPPSETPHPELMTYKDFKENAQTSTVFADAVAATSQERDADVADADNVRANETWNILAHQVVGQESF